MTQTEVLARLQTIFDEIFIEKVVVTPALSADQVSEWTSLLHISLVLTVEKAFRIRFKVGEVTAAQNVGDLITLIQQHLEGDGHVH